MDQKAYVLELFRMRTEAVCAALGSSGDMGYTTKTEFSRLMDDIREAWCDEMSEEASDGD